MRVKDIALRNLRRRKAKATFVLLGLLIVFLRSGSLSLPLFTDPSRSVAVAAIVAIPVILFSRLSLHRYGWARFLADEFASVLGPLRSKEIFLLAALSGLAMILGAGLSLAARFLSVEVDPRVLAIEAELPGANCGGCGQAGCSASAAAVQTIGSPMCLSV